MSKTEDKPLTVIQERALRVLQKEGPLISSMAGAAIWPDRAFKNAQGEALAGGGLLGKLRKKGLVEAKHGRSYLGGGLNYLGWGLTQKGEAALKAALVPVRCKHGGKSGACSNGNVGGMCGCCKGCRKLCAARDLTKWESWVTK